MSARCRGCAGWRWTTRSITPSSRRFSPATPPIPAPGPAPSRARKRTQRPRAAIVAMLRGAAGAARQPAGGARGRRRAGRPIHGRHRHRAAGGPVWRAALHAAQGRHGDPTVRAPQPRARRRRSCRSSGSTPRTTTGMRLPAVACSPPIRRCGASQVARSRGRRRAHRRLAALHRRHRRRARGADGDAAAHRVHRRAARRLARRLSAGTRRRRGVWAVHRPRARPARAGGLRRVGPGGQAVCGADLPPRARARRPDDAAWRPRPAPTWSRAATTCR